ncbi:hypothetical protein EPUS_01194 [Endocarpon pusillum Z07020]|uniref:Uncharacterized protein n=1 Tax=Endocarpon pusillum (strain Z07020 / HMAS-L-300199) TaxID=1263415 RepID=U1GTT0_ENDPU|nr:uncharacterized protein EPUS_01194 [Endocarpon pusillum Z07020]ERF75828.1 hypothetical protein EPUS_01194 [Endocarpon pusillum Z07020]
MEQTTKMLATSQEGPIQSSTESMSQTQTAPPPRSPHAKLQPGYHTIWHAYQQKVLVLILTRSNPPIVGKGLSDSRLQSEHGKEKRKIYPQTACASKTPSIQGSN